MESGADPERSASRDSEPARSRRPEQSPSRTADGAGPTGGTHNDGTRPPGGPSAAQNRGRYSRLVSLGLPNLKLDLEHSHFSRGSVRRRSQRLRQNADLTPDSTIGESSRAESVRSGTTTATTTTKDLIVINTGQESAEPKTPAPGRQQDDDPDATWPGLKLDLNYMNVADTAGQMLSQSMDALRNSLDRSALTGAPTPRRTRSGGIATPRAEATISYSFYQLQPPPAPSTTGQGVEVVKSSNSLTPKYRYVHNTKT